MLVRIVQQVAEHLPQPLRVAAEQGQLLPALGVVQLQVLPIRLPIGVENV